MSNFRIFFKFKPLPNHRFLVNFCTFDLFSDTFEAFQCFISVFLQSNSNSSSCVFEMYTFSVKLIEISIVGKFH